MAKTPASLDLLSRKPFEETFAAALLAVEQAGLRLIGQDVTMGEIKAEAGAGLTSSGEKIALSLEQADGGVHVRIVSSAASAMGSNRHKRHLDAISGALATSLGSEWLLLAAAASSSAGSGQLKADATRGIGRDRETESSAMATLRLGPETNFPEALKGHPGLGAFGVGRELRQLSSMLGPGEFLLDILQGTYAAQTGVLIRTTTRLIFFGKGIVSTKVEEFPLDKVTSVQYVTGLMLGDVTIFAAGNKAEVKNTVKAHTKTFVDGLRSQLDDAKKSAPLSSPGHAASSTMVELEKLAALKERGLLNDEEFTAAKRKVLGL